MYDNSSYCYTVCFHCGCEYKLTSNKMIRKKKLLNNVAELVKQEGHHVANLDRVIVEVVVYENML